MLGRRWVLCVVYLLAFVIPPLVFGFFALKGAYATFMSNTPGAPLSKGVLAGITAPVVDPEKPLVALLVDTAGTEATDLLIPYRVFAETQAYNVVTVAAEKKLSALFSGVDMLPHYTFDELRRLNRTPDVLVIPAIMQPGHAGIQAWLQEAIGQSTLVITICEGARVAAIAGIFDGLEATSHAWSIPALQKKYPAVRWVSGYRYVDSGQVISSAGVTSALEASLYAVARLVGQEEARRIADKLSYETTFKAAYEPRYPSLWNYATVAWNGAFSVPRPKVGVLMEEGVDEIALAAILDTFPRTIHQSVETIALPRTPVQSLHGLILVPRAEASAASKYDLTIHINRFFQQGTGFAFTHALNKLSAFSGRGLADVAAKQLEYPAMEYTDSRSMRIRTLIVPLVLGGMGVLLCHIVYVLVRRRKPGDV